MTDFDERTPSFYRDFYYEEVQTLLLSDEGGQSAGDGAAALAASATAVSGKQQPLTLTGTVVDSSGKDGRGPEGTSAPTCMEKLWAHLRALAGDPIVPAGQRSTEERQVCGAALPAMHASGPPALAVNRTGGSVRLRVLVDCLLSLRGTLIAPEATALSLLLAMDCAVPINSSAVPAPSSQRAADRETDASDPASSPEDFDLTCLEMRVDFLDFLELLCRAVASPLWVYRSPTSAAGLPSVLDADLSSSADGGEGHNGAEGHGGSQEAQQVSLGRDPEHEHEHEQDSASIYSVHLSDVLAERLAVWKQSFNFDAISSYRCDASQSAQAGVAPSPSHEQQ